MFLQFNKSNYKLCRTQIENERNYSLKKENRLMPRFLVFCYQTLCPLYQLIDDFLLLAQLRPS